MSRPVILAVDDDPRVSAASAVGEGAISICFVHPYLATT
jgi:hypothetical protein